jgi:ABC-type transporter lipoprotein component MlaA
MPTTLTRATVGNLAALVVRHWLDNEDLRVPMDALETAQHDHPAFGLYKFTKGSADRRAVLRAAWRQLRKHFIRQGKSLDDELQRRKGAPHSAHSSQETSARLRALPSAS